MIVETDALAAFCRRAGKAEYVTVDTEFIRDKTYWPRLCVVQIGTADEAVAVDALANGLDLKPLFDLMVKPDTIKVFHAARQDIEIFCQLSDRVPEPLFDTQVAAMVCGFGDSVSYERLVGKFANTAIDKSMRYTDWSRRPLTKKQIAYALDDVIHLRAVYEALSEQLVKTKRTEWVAEEMAILTDPETYRQDPKDAWKRVKTRSRNRRVLATMRELAAWREVTAQTRDVPRNRVLRDDALAEIAQHAPKSPEELSRLRAYSRESRSKTTTAEILDVIAGAAKIPDKGLPEAPPHDGNMGAIGPAVDLLKVLLKHRCEKHEVAQKLVATTDDIEAIARDDNADVRALQGWRHKIFGADALKLKQGKLALSAKGKNVKVIEIGD